MARATKKTNKTSTAKSKSAAKSKRAAASKPAARQASSKAATKTLGNTKPKTQQSPMPEPVVISRDSVAARAYQIWIEKGQPAGQDEINWLEAEAQVTHAA